MTAAGRVELTRRSARCPGCGLAVYPADARLGTGGFLSPGAVRLACLATASWSFDVASDRLEEIAGLRIDDKTIRRHVHSAADGLAARRQAEPPKTAFAAAGGDIEFLIDSVMAPTRSGWREVKLTQFQARPRGDPADPAGWVGRPRAAGPDGERLLRHDRRRRGVLGPLGRLGGGIGDRSDRPADGAGRQGGLDLGGGLEALPGGRTGVWTSSRSSSTSPRRPPGSSSRGPPRRPSGWYAAGPGSWPTAGPGCWTTSGSRRARAGRRQARRRWTR